ncbi:site-2 protease family protein [Candidatus Saccharibacteria bacterium]|nr:site-2 protease family protein [Candidatus Saccharibacteria bacterium]
MLIFVGVLLLISLVIVHEFGHFWAARKSGIEVEEFGIGFPPRAKVLTEKNGTKYTLNWLPLGGFVKLKGEHDSDTTKGSFGAAKLKNKVAVMVAGVFMNIIAAIVLLTIVAATGMPQVVENQFSIASDTKIVQQDVVVSYVSPGSPADIAGIKPGDYIKSIEDNNYDCDYCLESVDANKVEFTKSQDISENTKNFEGRDVVVDLVRDGKSETVTAKLLTKQEVEDSKTANQICRSEIQDTSEQCPEIKGYLGMIPSDYIKQRSTWSAPIVGTVTTFQFFGLTLQGLGGIIADLFHGQASVAGEQVTGVVGIGYILKEMSSQGFIAVLFLTAIISVSLAVMNILPIPALDGGRLFVTLIFRLFKKPLKKETEERIHATGFALLMMLFVLITVLDVKKFFIN